MQIPAEALTAIEAVIVNDEGGWKLTANPNDPDGGWTYAGVTAKVWNSYFDIAFSFEQMQKDIQEYAADVKDKVYQIYYLKYYQPLEQHFAQPTDYELSCAINCGVAAAVSLSSYRVDEMDKQTFLHKWLLHYADLVRKNAEAWRDWALHVSSSDWQTPGPEKPATLRAEFLAGWINRVEKYR